MGTTLTTDTSNACPVFYRSFCANVAGAWGYFVSTVGRDEAVIREYIRNQEREDSRLEQMNLWR